MIAGCDSYECFDEACDSGKKYLSCWSCETYGDSALCSVQSRTPENDVIDECEYESDVNAGIYDEPRHACSEQVKAAACKP
jgi:hypothetical protein